MSATRTGTPSINMQTPMLGQRHWTETDRLIEFTFTNATNASGKDWSKAGGHADVANLPSTQAISAAHHTSSPALVNLCWERHGSCSKRTREYFEACVDMAHARERLKL